MTDHLTSLKLSRELSELYQDRIDAYDSIYKLSTVFLDEIEDIFQKIKIILIEKYHTSPARILHEIDQIACIRLQYLRSFWMLYKMVYNEYKPTCLCKHDKLMQYFLYKEYGVLAVKENEFIIKKMLEKKFSLDVHEDNSIYKLIMNDDYKAFSKKIEEPGFDVYQRLYHDFYSNPNGLSLLEVCCYYGAANCFKALRNKYQSEVTNECVLYSFMSGNPDIMHECMSYKQPDEKCMEYAIKTHNINFVTYLKNQKGIDIDGLCCATYNNLQAFFYFVDEKQDLNYCLAISGCFNIVSLCEFFLGHGANINGGDSNGYSCLHYASEYGNREVMEFLIDNGAFVNVHSDDGETPLIRATKFCKKSAVELLLSHGAKVNEADKNGNIPLHFAFQCCNKETAMLLLSNGADSNKTDKDGTSCLHLALRNNNNIVQTVEQRNDEVISKEEFDAAEGIIKEFVELLISYGANVNAAENDGETPLHIASRFNFMQIVELLISYGANVNAEYNDKRTSLHLAASNNLKDVAEILITHGANINAIDARGKTTLHYAVWFDCKETVELLISKGADVNAKNEKGKALLHYAATNNLKDMAELLISHEANVNVEDENGNTPLHYAAANSKETAEVLILHGANVNAVEKHGKTSLHFAAMNGNQEMAELLLSHNVDVNAKDEHGKTPLDAALATNQVDLAKFLRSHGGKRSNEL